MRIPNNLPVPDKREFWSVLDSTKLQCYARCPRKYFFEYVLGWASDGISNHLVFGKSWHEALEYLYKNRLQLSEIPRAYEIFMQCYREELPENTDDWFKGKSPNRIPQALVEYCQTHASDVYEWEILATEIGGQVPISDIRMLALKMDIVARNKDNLIFGVEHKTGSQAGRTWEMQWSTSIQIGTYLHALAASYTDRADMARILVNGAFFYVKDTKYVRLWQQRVGWAMINWLDTVNNLYSMIEDDFERLTTCEDGHTTLESFYMNPTACTDYGGCSFFDLCIGIGNPLRYCQKELPITGYKYRWWNPLEDIKNNLTLRK